MPDIKKLLIMSVQAVIPVAALIFLFQLSPIRVEFAVFARFLAGSVMAIIGLALFFAGAHLGLLPLGEYFGSVLAKTGKFWVLVFFTFVIGYAITVAEPSVIVLAGHAHEASVGMITKHILVPTIGVGVAIFMAIAVVKMVKALSLKFILMSGYLLVFAATMFSRDRFIPLSYDAGGVTTGSVTVPFILAFGMGMALTLRGKDASSESFGMVGLASIGPILTMLILAMLFK